MSTEPEPTENTDPETRVAAPEPEPEPAPQGADAAPDAAPGPEADAEGAGADAEGEGAEATGSGDTEGDGADKAQLSEAEAELAAQRVERERIARRKAEKQGPVEAGAKLSGKAADLLAAVRAVESGAKPVAAVFSEPEPPRRPAQEAARSRPVSAAGRAGDGVGVGVGGAVGVVASPGGGGSPAGPGPEAVEAVRRVLAEGGAPEGLAPQVAAVLGEGADAELRADPWQLLRVAGVRPEQADGFARALLGAECAPDDERRGRAVTVWLLEQAALAGHTALEMPALTAALAQRGVPDTDAAVQSTIAEAEALVFQDALDPTAPEPAHPVEGAEDDEEGAERPVRILVGLERYALAEESLADGLARLINSVPKEDGSAEDWERAAASAKGSAAELIRATATHGLVLHTGGEASVAEPAALLEAARSLGLRAWAATHSPLGRDRFGTLLGAGRQGAAASQGAAHPGDARPHPGDARPHSGPGRPEDAAPPERTTHDQPAAEAPARPVTTVVTVAGLLSGAEGPGRDGDGAFDLDVLVVLDAPQLDVETAALLVECAAGRGAAGAGRGSGGVVVGGARAGLRGSARRADLPAGRLAHSGPSGCLGGWHGAATGSAGAESPASGIRAGRAPRGFRGAPGCRAVPGIREESGGRHRAGGARRSRCRRRCPWRGCRCR